MFCLCCKPKKKSKDQQKSNNESQQNQPVQTLSVSQSAPQNQPQRPPIAPRPQQNQQESQRQQIRVRNNSQDNAQSQRRQGEQEQRRPRQSQPQQYQNPLENSQRRVNLNQQSEQQQQQQQQEISQGKVSVSEIVVISNINKEQIETKELTPTKSQKKFFKYACPICWKYMNAILQTLCCRNYICHFCVEDFKTKKNYICPHCNFQGMKLVDVNQSEQVKAYSDSMANSMAKLMQINTAARLSQKGQELKMQQLELEEDEDNFERDSNEVYLSNSLIPRNIEQDQFYSSQGFKGSKQQILIKEIPSNQEERKSF